VTADEASSRRLGFTSSVADAWPRLGLAYRAPLGWKAGTGCEVTAEERSVAGTAPEAAVEASMGASESSMSIGCAS
jgi:hypothetical protein